MAVGAEAGTEGNPTVSVYIDHEAVSLCDAWSFLESPIVPLGTTGIRAVG
jgi:hypothetical protein